MCNRGVPQLYNFRFTPISPDAFTLSFAYIGCSYDIHSPILPLWTSVSAAPCVLHKALRQPHGLLAIASVYPVRFGCWALAGLGCASAGWAWAADIPLGLRLLPAHRRFGRAHTWSHGVVAAAEVRERAGSATPAR